MPRAARSCASCVRNGCAMPAPAPCASTRQVRAPRVRCSNPDTRMRSATWMLTDRARGCLRTGGTAASLSAGAPPIIVAEESVEIASWGGVGEASEAALLREQARRAHEPAPGRAGQRATDADAPHTQRCDIVYGELTGPAEQ